MVNISKLSNEELYTIIDSMPIDFLKLILKKESKNSSHLFHGFRVKNLSEERIHRKLKTNLKDVFVQHIIVTFLRNIYNEVRLQKNNYLKLENGEYEAFFKSIVKVIVPQMYEIYFKALEVPYTSETISALKLYENLHKNCERLETDIKTAQQNNEQLSNNNVELKAHITKLEKGNIVSAESLNTMRTELKKSTETIFELQTSIETSNREYQSIIESKDSEIDYLNNVISEKQRKFKAIETTNGELLTELTELKNSISNSENCTPSYIKLGYHISEDNVLVEEYTSNSELLNFLQVCLRIFPNDF